MARKRASPTAAPMMLGVLRFMVFSLVPVSVGRRGDVLHLPCQDPDHVIPGGWRPALSGFPDGATEGTDTGAGRRFGRGHPLEDCRRRPHAGSWAGVPWPFGVRGEARHESPSRLSGVSGYLLVLQACVAVRLQAGRPAALGAAHRGGHPSRRVGEAPRRSPTSGRSPPRTSAGPTTSSWAAWRCRPSRRGGSSNAATRSVSRSSRGGRSSPRCTRSSPEWTTSS